MVQLKHRSNLCFLFVCFFRNGGREFYRLFEDPQTTFPVGSTLNNYILYGLQCNPEFDNTIADCPFENNVQWFNAQQCQSR